MAKATPDLEARAEELDRREAALVEREEAAERATDRANELEQLIGAKDKLLVEHEERIEKLTAGGAKHLPTEEEFEGVQYAALPEPAAGNGFVVVEAPLPLVAVFANLHPSERHTISVQMAGAMRQTLMETGKLRRSEPDAPSEISLAILASGELNATGRG